MQPKADMNLTPRELIAKAARASACPELVVAVELDQNGMATTEYISF